MHITIMGTGGVGGYFGARLAAAGCKVSFVARGAQLAALQANGLRIESPLGDLHLARVQVTDTPATIGATDLVLFGVKLWDTDAAAWSLVPLMRERTVVVSLQNGVGKDAMLSEMLGAEHVAGGACYVSATIVQPGVIRHTGKMQKVVFGELDGTMSERLTRFRDACVAAGIDHELSADITQLEWEKFAFLVALSGTTTSMRAPIGVVRSNPQARAFFRDTMQEVVQVARASGVAIADDFVERRMAYADTLPAEMTSSMHEDLKRGGRLEVPWLSGDVVARGAAVGVATPCNRAIADVLAVWAEGRAG